MATVDDIMMSGGLFTFDAGVHCFFAERRGELLEISTADDRKIAFESLNAADAFITRLRDAADSLEEFERAVSEASTLNGHLRNR